MGSFPAEQRKSISVRMPDIAFGYGIWVRGRQDEAKIICACGRIAQRKFPIIKDGFAFREAANDFGILNFCRLGQPNLHYNVPKIEAVGLLEKICKFRIGLYVY